MKTKLFLFTIEFFFSITIYSQNRVTIAEWTFPSSDTISLRPDSCLSQNSVSYFSAEDTAESQGPTLRNINFTNGSTSFAATATGWDNGDGAKLWSVAVKTNSMSNLTVSSKQRSGGNYPGPENWKIQAKVSGQNWVDIPGGSISLTTNSWVSVNDLPLGSNFDNQTSSIHIRWIMVSDSSTAGTIVDALGISKIDDVVIMGTNTTGIQEVLYNNALNFYPNPVNAGILNIESTKSIRLMNIYNFQGQCVQSISDVEKFSTISMKTLESGIYFIRVEYNDNSTNDSNKLVIR